MTPKTYDPKFVSVIAGGIPLTGFPDGTFVSYTRDEDTYNKQIGADGVVSRSKTNNRSGVLTLTLQQTSQGNDVLTGFFNLDELSNSGVFVIVIKDVLGTTILQGSAWIKKPADIVYSKEIEGREWTIDVSEESPLVIGGNP